MNYNMFGVSKIMTTFSYSEKIHGHDVSPVRITEKKYYKLQGYFRPTNSNYNYFYQDEHIQNNLVEIPSKINISREFTSGKSKFIDSKRDSFIRTSDITTNVNPSKEISINNKRIFPPKVLAPNTSKSSEHVSKMY